MHLQKITCKICVLVSTAEITNLGGFIMENLEIKNRDVEGNSLELTFVAEDVTTMKETTEDGVIRTRRWVKINVEEFRKMTALSKWTDINPRVPDEKLKPARDMRSTLNGDDRDIFHHLNRGISISAANCTVINIKDKKKVTIRLSNKDEHGVFDGGHSMIVLMKALENNEILGLKHVMLEIFTGVEDILSELARARNTNTQVKERSLANLDGKFDFIKEALKDECFFNNISWVENADGDISVNFIIQILTAFNKNLEHKSMIKTYSGAGSCETTYIKEFDKNVGNIKNNLYYKLTPLYSDIFSFVDYVLVSLPEIYNKNGYESKRGMFGKLRGITYKSDHFPLLFSPNEQKTSYKIPNSLFFPIIGAMRQLYKEGEDGMYEWIVEPKVVFDAISTKLVTKVMGVYFDKNRNVNEVGKTLSVWIDTYELVNSYLNDYLKEQELKELRKRLAKVEKAIV